MSAICHVGQVEHSYSYGFSCVTSGAFASSVRILEIHCVRFLVHEKHLLGGLCINYGVLIGYEHLYPSQTMESFIINIFE